MNDICPVVRIVSKEHKDEGGFIEINESDFDPAVHQLFDSGAPQSDDVYADMKVEDMKALLDASSVNYRANATEESLRKLCREKLEG